MSSHFEGFTLSRTHQSGWRIEPDLKLYHRVLSKSIPASTTIMVMIRAMAILAMTGHGQDARGT